MTASEYNDINKTLNDRIDEADERLKSVIAGNVNNIGLVNDDIKKTDAYTVAKRDYAKAFEAARKFRQNVPNSIKRDAALLRRGLNVLNRET